MKYDVKDMWWKGDDFFIETKDGKVIKLTGAYISNYERDVGENDYITVEKLTFEKPNFERFVKDE